VIVGGNKCAYSGSIQRASFNRAVVQAHTVAFTGGGIHVHRLDVVERQGGQLFANIFQPKCVALLLLLQLQHPSAAVEQRNVLLKGTASQGEIDRGAGEAAAVGRTPYYQQERLGWIVVQA